MSLHSYLEVASLAFVLADDGVEGFWGRRGVCVRVHVRMHACTCVCVGY